MQIDLEKNTNTLILIQSLFEKNGENEYFGEAVSQYSHAAQACLLAEKQGYDLEVQIAAFLHDIGHLLEVENSQDMGAYGQMDHEEIASEWLLVHGFSKKIAEIIKNHVNAKRYLTFIDADYYWQLSEASKKTLEYQGGKMSESEALNFEHNEFFSQIIRLRRWDDAAKIENLTLPKLEYFLQKIATYFQINI